MHCEIQSEQTEVTKTHTPSKQDCLQEFSTVDNNDSLPLEKETSPLRKIIDAWNRLHLTPFNGRNPALPGKISTLLSLYSLETILQTIASITKSQFLLGKKGNSRWCITLEWLLNPANFAKVLSGKYLDKTRNNCQSTDSSYSSEMWRPGQQLPFFLPGEGEESMSPAETEKGLASLFRPITQQQKEAAKLLGLPA